MRPNKVLILYGARRVGKTSLLESYLNTIAADTHIKLNGEDVIDNAILDQRSVANNKRILHHKELLVIDEAQKIGDIGLKLKLIVDHIPNLKVLVTGSSQFDLQNQLAQPLVGRKNTMHFFPLSQKEFSQMEDYKKRSKTLRSN